jgi:large subunit ribosomal protein L3
MAGRMGSDRITQKNVKILNVDVEAGLILVKGAVPGKRGTLIEIVQK